MSTYENTGCQEVKKKKNNWHTAYKTNKLIHLTRRGFRVDKMDQGIGTGILNLGHE